MIGKLFRKFKYFKIINTEKTLPKGEMADSCTEAISRLGSLQNMLESSVKSLKI